MNSSSSSSSYESSSTSSSSNPQTSSSIYDSSSSSSIYDSSSSIDSSSSSIFNSSSSTGTNDQSISLPIVLVGWAIACLVVTVLFTSYLVKYYAQHRLPLPIKLIVWLSWLCCFSIVFLVPLDLAINLTDEQSINPLSPVFATVYWISMVCSWALLPFIQEYYDNGGFTIKHKTKIAMRNNLIFVFVALTAFIGVCLYLWLARIAGIEAILTTFKVLSNVIGFCLIICLMGSGFVEFPRLLYHSSNRERLRDLLYYQLTQTHHEAGEVRDRAVLMIRLIDYVDEKIAQQNDAKLTKYMNKIKERITEPINQSNQSIHVRVSIYDRMINQSTFTVDDLIALNGSLKKTLDQLWLCDRLWSDTMKHVLRLEQECGDISINQSINQSIISRTYHQSIKPKLFFIGSLLFSLVSLMLLWCELSIPIRAFNGVDVNPFTYLVDWLIDWPLIQQPIVVLLLIYCMVCALYPLFKLRLSSLYYLGRHHSSANSLIILSTLMLRASIALAYNFSLLLSIPSSGFGQLLSSITEVPFFGNSFNTIFPIFILLVALLVSINALQRLFACLGIDRFHFIRQSMEMERELSDSQHEAKMAVKEGKHLVNREKRKRDAAQRAGQKYQFHTSESLANDESTNQSIDQSNNQSTIRSKRARDPMQTSLLNSSTSSYGTSDDVIDDPPIRSVYGAGNDTSTNQSTNQSIKRQSTNQSIKRQSAYASAYYGSSDDQSVSRQSTNQSTSQSSNTGIRGSAYGGAAYGIDIDN